VPLNSAHYAMLYPQNGERTAVVDFVTSFHPVYSFICNFSNDFKVVVMVTIKQKMFR